MSITLFLLVGGGAAAAGWIAGRFARRRGPSLPPPVSSAGAPTGYELGDVLVRSPDDDVLLSSALTLREGAERVATVYVASRRNASRRVVVELAPPASDVLWLAETTLPSYREPPSTLPTEPPLDRASRRSVSVERSGDDAPALGATAVVAFYRDARGRAALYVCGADASLVAVGEAVPSRDVDRFPRGDG